MPVTGRRLDERGEPIDGTGFTYASGGPIATLLTQRASLICSQPITGEWVFSLVAANKTNGAYARGVGIFPPGNMGPPEHFHPIYDESFEIVQGRFIFRIGGQEREVAPGEQIVVPKGVPHTFRCVGNEVGALLGETRPAARIGEVITTLFGMAHEGLLTPEGRPKLLQAMVIGSEYADDTVMCSPPPAVTLPIARALAPLSRLLGYRPIHARYLSEEFWRAHVEQPE